MVGCVRSWAVPFLLLSLAIVSVAQDDKGSPDSAALASAQQALDKCRTTDRVLDDLQRRVVIQPSAALYDELGVQFGRAENYACAAAAFEAALAVDPTATQARYDLALALIQSHNPEQALHELGVVLQQQPTSFAAHNARGLSFQDSRKPEDAEQE